jgi:hypothetical protein
MRILDQKTDKGVKNAILYLTLEEAGDLRLAIDDLINSKDEKGIHYHVADSDFSHEITVCLYSLEDTNFFNERSVKLIRDDE